MGLRGYLLKRAINTFILILFVITLNFAIFQLLPGTQGVIANLLQNPRLTDKSIIGKYENEFGLCASYDPATNHCVLATAYQRFGTYFVNMLTFNFGVSYQSGHPIFDDMILTGRLYNTLLLLGVSTLFSLLIGIFIGVFVAARRGTVFDTGWVTTSLVTYSLPTFWVGIVLIEVVAGRLQWLPAGGTGGVAHYVMPAFTLGWFVLAGMMRLLRSSLLEVLDADFVRTARAKGVPEAGVVWRHALRNALIPVVTFAGVYFAILVTTAIVVETVFAWPGMGRLAYEAITARDFPVIQAVVLVTALVVVLVNLAVDCLYVYLDPRLRAG